MRPKKAKRFGFVLTDTLVATAISGTMFAGMLVGFITLKRGFAAGEHYAKTQIEQDRLIDYVARDLRRATTVNVDQLNNAPRITVSIPDYYDSNGDPRDPVIVTSSLNESEISYGGSSSNVTIQYYQLGNAIYRSVNGNATLLVSDVETFLPDYADSGKQTIGISVSFVPKFRPSPDNISTLRDGTAAYTTVLLRNKRRTASAQ